MVSTVKCAIHPSLDWDRSAYCSFLLPVGQYLNILFLLHTPALVGTSKARLSHHHHHTHICLLAPASRFLFVDRTHRYFFFFLRCIVVCLIPGHCSSIIHCPCWFVS